MIDIHSHILPAVDDGSTSIENSIKMLQDLLANGVTDVILTPHHRGKYVLEQDVLKEKFEEFKILTKDVPVNLYLGQEFFIDKNTIKDLVPGKVVTLNDSNYVLLEFDYFNFFDIPEAVYVAKARGFIPVVAHVERYEYLNLDEIYEIKALGGLIQINASSLVKKMDKHCYKRSKKLLKSNLVDFIASDCHDFRPIVIGDVRKMIEKKFGQDTARKLFDTNALPIIKGQA